jgi:hypothetical protein
MLSRTRRGRDNLGGRRGAAERVGGALPGPLEKRQTPKEEQMREYVYEKSRVFGMTV